MYIVVMNHNFSKETKTFDSKDQMYSWAERNGFTLEETKSPTVFVVTF